MNAWRWCRRNLFATTWDTALTILIVATSVYFLSAVARWALVDAHWSVVFENIRVFLVGTYPAADTARAWITSATLCFLCGMSLGSVAGASRALTMPLAAASAVLISIGFVLGSQTAQWSALCVSVAAWGWLVGGLSAAVRRSFIWLWAIGIGVMLTALSPALIERWGGLLMSVIFTLLAAALSVPLGIALCLGRRSRHPSLRVICSSYIEVMRALPLILVVYCIWIIVPLIMPDHPGPDLLRGLLGFSAFFAAYVAEYVRSGLQSIPKGQIEAAQSLGLSPRRVNFDVVLPQALRVAIPGIVGNVLDIFNTVPLLFIIGMTDFLRAGQMILINPQLSTRTYEIYGFMFAVYLFIASLITFGARRLEARMSAGSA
jgi:general L-amino acid transport system permease protein